MTPRPAVQITNALTSTADSCLFTKKAAALLDSRQRVPDGIYQIPDEPTRELCAKLVLEEALETIKALGFDLIDRDGNGKETYVTDPHLVSSSKEPVDYLPDLEDIIDGCCDVIYVATGTLIACGVPDAPHLAEVCRANNSKFPDGKAIMHPTSGKYLKPEGWLAPDHSFVEKAVRQLLAVRMEAEKLKKKE